MRRRSGSGFWGTVVRRAAELTGNWLAPPACAACDAALPAKRTAFCGACATTVERADGQPFAPFIFGGALKTAIVRLKYEHRADLALPLGELLRASVVSAGLRADLVVPVPLHPLRLVERGYNQAALLAAHVARDIAPLSTAVRRVEARKRQASLARDERLANLGGAFVARPIVSNKTVMLIDDVRTTGATLAAAEAALRDAGAAKVVPVSLCWAR
ncbi:MAG: ComF family protein [Polyangiaceae bacterium]|nr:ComF family protein [Polyangiaceae bacterium]